MQSDRTRIFGLRGGRLVAVIVVPLAHAGGAFAQGPDEVHLTGLVRDFWSAHPDFSVTPSAGVGHYAQNVAFGLGADGRPIFAPTGYKVAAEWMDAEGRTIAPHMYAVDVNDGGTAMPNIVASGRIRARNTSAIDSYDSSVGPYGGANVGANAYVVTNSTAPGMIVLDNSSMLHGDAWIGPGGDPAVVVDDQGGDGITGTIEILADTYPIPTIEIPEGLPPYTGEDLDFPMNSNMSLVGSHHVDLFNVRRGANLTIFGDVTVVCEDRFLVGKDAQILVPDGSSLTVYCKTQMRMYGPNTMVNPDTSNPDKVHIYIMGSDPYNDQLVINGGDSDLCARVVAPDNVLDLDQNAEFFGTFIGEAIELNNTSQMHVDLRTYETTGSCIVVDDVAGLEGPMSDGGISSPDTFNEWYRDVLGTNQSAAHVITLTRNGEGVYEYLNSGFYPIDGQLFGNEDDEHNRFFTFAIEAEFTYDACSGQFVSFQGGDGTWMFIDDQMVLDLGGVMPVGEQIIELDRLGLVDGQAYSLHLFYADRNDFSAVFRLRTNIELNTDGVLPNILAVFD